MAKILVIDDNENIRTNLCDIMSDEGHEAVSAQTGEEGLHCIKSEIIDLVLLDVRLPGIDGLEVLRQIKQLKPDVEVILISGHGTIAKAVEAMKTGAYDFLEKPLSTDRVLIVTAHALEKRQFNRERQEWLQEQDRKYRMIGESPAMRKIWDDIKSVAGTNARVLITGESGTGKELVSYWIYRLSKRSDKPFVKMNCAAIPTELIESELFGHERGAFTGAHKRVVGKFELAHTGTIFLDEIGDMNVQTQAKVLRIMESGEFSRLGGQASIQADCRIIVATNKDLAKEIQQGRFREDLYHRINVFRIHVPSLRERKTDIPLLARHIIKEYCFENGFSEKTLDRTTEAYLCSLPFAGNIRELKNVIERAVIKSKTDTIAVDDLEQQTASSKTGVEDVFARSMTLSDAKRHLEKQYIVTQLTQNGWNIAKTAEKLGVERSNLSRRIKQLKIEKP